MTYSSQIRYKRNRRGRRVATFLQGVALALGAPSCAYSQVATDGSLGARLTLPGPQIRIPATLGQQAGVNLFHSFAVFNVGRGETATFLTVPATDHVIARITGGTASEILGRVGVDGGRAGLFLLNPSGIVFGAGASIDVPGAFHATTADGIRFADGVRFSARADDPGNLSMAAPAALSFSLAGGPITVSGAGLVARPGQALGLVGGDLRIERATLAASAGRVGLVATGGSGDVAVGSFAASGFRAMGRIEVLNGTVVTVAEASSASTGSGRILIRGGQIVVDHSRLDADTRRGNAGAIEIAADGDLGLHGADVTGQTRAAGAAATISLSGGRVAIDGGTIVDTSCDLGCTTGDGGLLRVSATGQITLAGTTGTPSYLVANSFGGGATGRVELSGPRIELSGAAFVQSVATAAGSSRGIGVTAQDLTVTGGAQVDASTHGSGAGGKVDVSVGRLLIDGSREDPAGPVKLLPSGLFANTSGSGNAGAITVRAESVRVLGGGEISGSAHLTSTGSGGTIALLVDGEVEVAGLDPRNTPGRTRSSGIRTNSFSSGRAGDIVIRADRVVVRDSGNVQSQGEASGSAGGISIDARSLTLSSDGPPGIFGARISTSNSGTSAGGSIRIRLSGPLRIEGPGTGVFANTVSTRDGGSIDIVADGIEITRGGTLLTDTGGSGSAGTISARALSHFFLGPGGSVVTSSFVDPGAGRAGIAGLAGDIVLASGGSLDLRGLVAGRANLSDGGNITIVAAGLAVMDGARVVTEVESGSGSGGNIELRLPTLVLRQALIDADAHGGSGGNIRIGSSAFFGDPASKVTASSTLGIDGTIQLDSPAVDLSGAFATPLPRFLDADSILAGRCNARLAGRASSLSVVVRDERPGSGLTYFLARGADAAAGKCTPTPPPKPGA